MTIRKGESWGQAGALPPNGVVVDSDRAANRVVNQAMSAGLAVPPLGLVGGDLARALGATGDINRLSSASAQQLPLDLGEATFNGQTIYFVAHLLLRQPFWQGRFVAAMNTDFWGSYKLTPRAHPNDGLLDILDGKLDLNDRLKAKKLALTGEHVPHPNLVIRRVKERHLLLEKPTPIWVDGEKQGRTQEVTLRVLPDAALCVV